MSTENPKFNFLNKKNPFEALNESRAYDEDVLGQDTEDSEPIFGISIIDFNDLDEDDEAARWLKSHDPLKKPTPGQNTSDNP